MQFLSSYRAVTGDCEGAWGAVTDGWRCSWGWRWGMGMPLGQSQGRSLGGGGGQTECHTAPPPLQRIPWFQGLESVEAFKEQYDQLLQHDVDQIIMDRRIERLCKAYDDNMSLVRRSVERKSGEQAHRQWQEVEKILGNLQEDGADHDLTRHDSVQSLLAKHKEVRHDSPLPEGAPTDSQ